jgi:hypothetical protein
LSSDQTKLILEVLQRANQTETQQYKEIFERKLAISKRMTEVSYDEEVLSEREKLNTKPETPRTSYNAPDKSHGEIVGMSSGKLHEWTQQVIKENEEYIRNSKKYNEELEIYSAKSTVIMREHMKLIEDSVALKVEFDGLERKEKWLLITIALRSQPNLLNYLQSDKKDATERKHEKSI